MTRFHGKLSQGDVVEIVAACRAGELQRVVAGRYGVTQAAVSYVVNSVGKSEAA